MPDFKATTGFVYDVVPDRDRHRVSVLYAVDRAADIADDFGIDYAELGEPVISFLSLDRLESCYEAAERQFPRVFERIELDPTAVNLQLPSSKPKPLAARVWFFGLPHGSIIIAFTLEIACDVLDCIPTMEVLHHKKFCIDDTEPWDAFQALASAPTRALLADGTFGTDTHQMIFVAANCVPQVVDIDTGSPRHEEISQLIYRFRADYRENLPLPTRIRYPAEANRATTSVAATGPYVGVVAGQQGYIENALFVSAIQMVAASALLRRIRTEAYDELLRLRRLTKLNDRNPQRTRTQLAVMSERLGRLELELSFGVEAHERIGSLLPSLRVIDYHFDLFNSADMPAEAATTSRMLERLSRVIQAELEGVRAHERTADERRRLTGSLALGFLSIVALPLGLIFGYFGINTSDVAPGTRFSDIGRYPLIYALIAILFLLVCAMASMLFWIFRRQDRRHEEHRKDVIRL